MFLVCLTVHYGFSWAQNFISPAARKKETIAAYTVQRPKQRMLGGIVLARPVAWFFKVSGPDELVSPQKEAFETFLKSVKLGSRPSAEPTWTLPEGWKQLDGNDTRFATIQMGSTDEPLDLTVTLLGMPEIGESAYLLSNINRWRAELGLEPIGESELPKETKRLKAGSREVVLVDLSAYLDGVPNQENLYTRALDDIEAMARMRGEPQEMPEIKYTLPKGWKETPPVAPQIHRFVTGDPDDPVVISISSAGGGRVDNIDRWRRQVGLGPISQDELASAVSPTQVFDLKAEQIEIIGPPGEKQQAILGVIAPSGRTSWFIKLQGPVKPALEQKKNFEAFVKSLQME
jgi:hypothetical protein